MKFLITGGCGFLGSNLAASILRTGKELLIIDNLSRFGSDQNLNWLKSLGQFEFHKNDTSDFESIEKIFQNFKPDVVFHLAGQVAMTTSLANPRRDFETNVIGGFNVLEAVRKNVPYAIVVYSSTNKVYGDIASVNFIERETRYEAEGYPFGFDESIPLQFESPYGCSKGATDQYMLDYNRMFGIKTVVFRHSSIYGGRQFSTVDQGWVGWFVKKAIESKNCNDGVCKFNISGNGKQVRDVLFSDDLINCYFSAIEAIESIQGKAFNIGGGVENSLSLLELFDILENKLSVALRYEMLPWRASDQKVFIADIRNADCQFGWKPTVNKYSGIERMIEWVTNN